MAWTLIGFLLTAFSALAVSIIIVTPIVLILQWLSNRKIRKRIPENMPDKIKQFKEIERRAKDEHQESRDDISKIKELVNEYNQRTFLRGTGNRGGIEPKIRNTGTETANPDVPDTGTDIQPTDIQPVDDDGNREVKRRNKSTRFNPI